LLRCENIISAFYFNFISGLQEKIRLKYFTLRREKKFYLLV